MKFTKFVLFFATVSTCHLMVLSAPASISSSRNEILEDFLQALTVDDVKQDISSSVSHDSESEWWEGFNGQQHIVKWNSLGNYDKVYNAKYALVMFYAEWCGDSKKARNAFAGVAEKLAGEQSPVTVGAVNCETSREICDTYSVRTIPRFLFLAGGVLQDEYNLNRTTVNGLYKWVLKNVNNLKSLEYTNFEESKSTSMPGSTHQNEATTATIEEKNLPTTSEGTIEKLVETTQNPNTYEDLHLYLETTTNNNLISASDWRLDETTTKDLIFDSSLETTQNPT